MGALAKNQPKYRLEARNPSSAGVASPYTSMFEIAVV